MDERHAMAAWLIEPAGRAGARRFERSPGKRSGPGQAERHCRAERTSLERGEVSNTNDWIVAGVLSQLMVKGLVRRPRRGQYEIV